jgi:HPt (histidine-containing phosphotransfer) domain-containing protein
MADGASALRFLARVWGDALGFPIDADALVTAAETGDFSSDAVPRDPRQQQGGQQGDHAGAGAERSTSTLSAGPKTMPAPNQPGSAQRRSTRGVDTPNDDDNNNSDNNNGNKDNSNINANSNGTDNHGSHAAAHHRDTAVTHGALPRAVVLDINLPTISGVAVTRMIRLMEQHHPTLPRMHIVIASGSVMESFSGEFTALIDGSIAKPFRRVDVLHALVPLFKVLFRAKTGPDDATADLQHPRKGPGSPNPTRRQPQSASASQKFLRGPADAAPMRTARYPSSQGSDGVIDFAVAASLDPDDIEFVAELVESFLTEARSQCAELGRIAAAAPELDWTTTKRVSHQLAGTAGSVGMARIGRLAATLEEHAKLALEEHAKLALGADGDTAEAQAHDPDTLAISADTLAISAQCAVDLIEELASTTAESAAQWEAGRESGLLREAARNARDDGA